MTGHTVPLGKVKNRSDKQLWVILEVADSRVAPMAEQPSYLSSFMCVVNSKVRMFAQRLNAAATPTTSTLDSSQLFVVLRGKPVGTSQVVVSPRL